MKRTLIIALLAVLIAFSAFLSGCGCDDNKSSSSNIETHTTETATDTTQETTVSSEVEQAVKDSQIKVAKDGNVEDKTSDGKRVKVSAETVNSVNNASSNKTSNSKTNSSTSKNNSSSSKANTSSKPQTKPQSSQTSQSGNSTQNSQTSKADDPHAGKTYHEAVYKGIKHPAETKKVWVVDKEAYTYEEPVYEEQDRAICKRCGADITDNLEHIFDCNSSYKVVSVKVKTGTKTITVPEEGHWETKVIKEAWTEKVLVKEAGYY